MRGQDSGALRRGWTTGACAAALLTGRFPDPVLLRLPRGRAASFPLALAELGEDGARAGIIKDAGDDPDVTHGALIVAEVAPAPAGSGVRFATGEGVGRVTRPGLPLAVGEPAINSAPRAIIGDALHEVAEANDAPPPDVTATISIPGGERLAEKTLNARLGIVGGLSILGTTGIVVPYSCSSWIHAIHRGIDVARAAGLDHIAAATGATSERAVQRLYELPDHALIDMGDFVGGMLKYLRAHPVGRLTIAGGFAKLSKLAAGHLDLHSGRSRVDTAALGAMLAALGADEATLERSRAAGGAGELLAAACVWQEPLARLVAVRAREVALATLSGKTAVEVAIVDRDGGFLARVGGWGWHGC
jgi:cobalt-precorrin-5B (C1)-methyltransferase